jgi:hypothetical protein
MRDFMKRLERDIPDPYGPKAVTQAVGLAPPPQAPEGGRAPAEGAGGFGGFLGGLLGVEGEAPPPARP